MALSVIVPRPSGLSAAAGLGADPRASQKASTARTIATDRRRHTEPRCAGSKLPGGSRRAELFKVEPLRIASELRRFLQPLPDASLLVSDWRFHVPAPIDRGATAS